MRQTVRGWLGRIVGPPVYDELAVVKRALGQRVGVLVDVGAHVGSSLRPFAREGWFVLAVEPDPQNRAELVATYGDWPNIRIDPRAVSERDGELLSLYTSDVSTGISALAPFHPSHRPTTQVETVRLDTLLADDEVVTVLKTDLEGWDLPAIRTFPWDRLRPRAVVCEFEDRKTHPLGYGYDDLAEFLVGLGYVVLTSEWHPVVEYGRQHRWRSIRRYPAALADPSAWGNLIAVEARVAVRTLRIARAHGARLRVRRLADARR
jgi:FkbM family methyltransferase